MIFISIEAWIEQIKASIVNLRIGVIAYLARPQALWLCTFLKLEDRPDLKRDKLAEERNEFIEKAACPGALIKKGEAVKASLNIQIQQLMICSDLIRQRFPFLSSAIEPRWAVAEKMSAL